MTKRFPSIFSFSKLAMVAVAAMVAFGSPGSVRAELSVNQFFEAVDSSNDSLKNMATDAIAFTGHGIFWANMEMKSRSGSGLYCQPDKLAVEAEQYVSILRKFAKKFSWAGELQMGGVLVKALQDVFPCK